MKQPWERTTYIPSGSTTYIHCTTANQGQELWWAVQLANSQIPRQFSSTSQNPLNGLGYYGVTENDDTTIKLLINGSTADINGTAVECFDFHSVLSAVLAETTLIVYGKFVVIIIYHYFI